MPLDFTRIAAQVTAMISSLKDSRAERRQRLQNALETLNNPAIGLDDLKQKIKAAKTSWLVAELTDGLNRRYPAPPIPNDFTVMATDGSHIDVDRHRSTRCYLINIGSVSLTYGSAPDAVLSSTPRLYADESDMVIANPGSGRDQVLDANLTGIKRSVEEWRALADMAAGQPAGSTTLAILDGTLIQWGLSGNNYPQFVRDVLLRRGFLRSLDEMKKLNGDRRLAVASYISYPGGSDVVNALRIVLCPGDVINDAACEACTTKECERVTGIRDRDIFAGVLEEGERSALFISTSSILEEYGDHRVWFFYLNVGEEIARIEIPEWVAKDKALLDLTHGLVLDQCRRGHGYPVVLSESHEHAVVTGADRENFWETDRAHDHGRDYGTTDHQQ
ncbi:MAG: DNA double-strand break repair nuclease NurA [Dehalococcoidales bacterium]|nr:DNA double-strand break repair nuclease NurA [Dehalococcoidales bacterium]